MIQLLSDLSSIIDGYYVRSDYIKPIFLSVDVDSASCLSDHKEFFFVQAKLRQISGKEFGIGFVQGSTGSRSVQKSFKFSKSGLSGNRTLDTTVTSQKHSHGHVHHHHNRMGDVHTALQPPSTTHHHPPQVSLETHQTEKGGPNTTIAATTHHLHECEVRPQHYKCLSTSHCYLSRLKPRRKGPF